LKNSIKRYLSYFLVICIVLSNNYSYAYPTLFKEQSHAQRYLEDDLTDKTLDILEDPSCISIPQLTGRVVESFKGKGDSLVIHIQDRHADNTAQLNIAKIIDEIVSKYDTHLICLEGASKELDTSFYDKFPDGETKDEVSKFFVEKAIFTGAEYYKITNKDKYLRAFGAEDKDTYLEHLASYRNNIVDKDKILDFLKAVTLSIDNLKDKIYTKPLKEIDKSSKEYALKNIQLPEYLKTLKAYSEKAGLDISKYKNLNKFIKLVKQEERIDFKNAESQREALISKLTGTLEKEELNKLVSKSLEFKLGKITQEEFYNYLRALIKEQNLNEKEYRDLIAYCQYLDFSKAINHLAVFDEAEDFEYELMLSLCKTQTQKDLVLYSKSAKLLYDLYDLKLTHRQLGYLDKHPEYSDIQNMQQFFKKTYNQYALNLPSILTTFKISQSSIDNSKEYYSLAIKRDNALINNTLSRMQHNRKDKAMLVTGGFHTNGITNILKEKNISYIVICPNIGNGDYETIYSDRMTGKLPSITEMWMALSNMLLFPLALGDAAPKASVTGINELFAAGFETITIEDSSATEPEIVKTKSSAGGRAGANREIPIQRPIVDARVDTEKAQDWIDAQPTPELKRLAEFVIKNITYVDQGKFEKALSYSIAQFNSECKQDFVVSILGPTMNEQGGSVKSGGWTLQIAMENGLLSPAGIADGPIGSVGGDTSQASVDATTKWLLQHKEINDIVYIDDAAFSGDQVSDWATRFAIQVSEEGDLLERGLTIYFIIPFMTTRAEKQIRDSVSKLSEHFNLNITATIYCSERILSVEEMSTVDAKERKDLLETLYKTYGSNSRYKTLFYFQHKVPDFKSVVSAVSETNFVSILKGPIVIGDGPDRNVERCINFVPIVDKTPYQEGYLEAVKENVQNTQWASRIISPKTSSTGIAFGGNTREFKLLLAALLHAQGSVSTVKAILQSEGPVMSNPDLVNLLLKKTTASTPDRLIQAVNSYAVTEDAKSGLAEIVQLASYQYGKDYSATQGKILSSLDTPKNQTSMPEDTSAKTEALPKMEKSSPSVLHIQDRIETLEDIKFRIKEGALSDIINFGDQHGDAAELRKILKTAQQAAQDGRELVIIGHGDAFDRGFQNFENFRILRELKQLSDENPNISVHFLLGNHDVMLIQGVLLDDSRALAMWLGNGGQAFVQELGIHVRNAQDVTNNRQIWALALWLIENLDIFQVDERGFLHVHAGIPMDQNGNSLIQREQLNALQQKLSDIQKGLKADVLSINDNSVKQQLSEIFHNAESVIWAREGDWIDMIKGEQIEIDDINKTKLFKILEKLLEQQMPGVNKTKIDQSIRDNWQQFLLRNPEIFKGMGIRFELLDAGINKEVLDNFLAKLGINGVVFGHIHKTKLMNIDNRIFCVDVNEGDPGHLIFNGEGIRFNAASRPEDIIATQSQILAGINGEIIRLKKILGEDARQLEAEHSEYAVKAKVEISNVAQRAITRQKQASYPKELMRRLRQQLQIVWANGAMGFIVDESTQTRNGLRILDIKIGTTIGGVLSRNPNGSFVVSDSLLIRDGESLLLGKDMVTSAPYSFVAGNRVFDAVLVDRERFIVGEIFPVSKLNENAIFILLERDVLFDESTFKISRVLSATDSDVVVSVQEAATSATAIKPVIVVKDDQEAEMVFKEILNMMEIGLGLENDMTSTTTTVSSEADEALSSMPSGLGKSGIAFGGNSREFKLLLATLMHSQGIANIVEEILQSRGPIMRNTDLIDFLLERTTLSTPDELVQAINHYATTECTRSDLAAIVQLASEQYGKDYYETQNKILSILDMTHTPALQEAEDIQSSVDLGAKQQSISKWDKEFPELGDEVINLPGERDPAGQTELRFTYAEPVEINIGNTMVFLTESSHGGDVLTLRWMDPVTKSKIRGFRLSQEEVAYFVGRNSLGQGVVNHVDIQDGAVSRCQFIIERKGRKVIIKDINSKNGTQIEKAKIDSKSSASGEATRDKSDAAITINKPFSRLLFSTSVIKEVIEQVKQAFQGDFSIGIPKTIATIREVVTTGLNTLEVSDVPIQMTILDRGDSFEVIVFADMDDFASVENKLSNYARNTDAETAGKIRESLSGIKQNYDDTIVKHGLSVVLARQLLAKTEKEETEGKLEAIETDTASEMQQSVGSSEQEAKISADINGILEESAKYKKLFRVNCGNDELTLSAQEVKIGLERGIFSAEVISGSLRANLKITVTDTRARSTIQAWMEKVNQGVETIIVYSSNVSQPHISMTPDEVLDGILRDSVKWRDFPENIFVLSIETNTVQSGPRPSSSGEATSTALVSDYRYADVKTEWQNFVDSAFLYHGTSSLFIDTIMSKGLSKDAMPFDAKEIIRFFELERKFSDIYTAYKNEKILGKIYIASQRDRAELYAESAPETINILLRKSEEIMREHEAGSKKGRLITSEDYEFVKYLFNKYKPLMQHSKPLVLKVKASEVLKDALRISLSATGETIEDILAEKKVGKLTPAQVLEKDIRFCILDFDVFVEYAQKTKDIFGVTWEEFFSKYLIKLLVGSSDEIAIEHIDPQYIEIETAKDTRSSSSGEALQIVNKAWNTLSTALDNTSIFKFNKYGLIIYESALQGSEEERAMIEELVSIKNTRSEAKFEIIIVPSSDETSIIKQLGITGVKTVTEFLSERNIDIPNNLSDQIVKVADALKNQMPIGVVADHTVDADTIARRLNPDKGREGISRRDQNQKYVFVTALPNPADLIIDGKPCKASKVAFSDILSKLALYDELVAELESLPYKERIAKILCNILDATDIAQFTTQIEAIKHAIDEIAKAA